MKSFLPFFAAFFSLSAHAADPQWQTPASIEAAARIHAETHGVKLGTQQKLEAGPLDERIRLLQCSNPLSTAFASGANTPPRMTVEVRCPGARGWKVYVPVAAHAFDRTVVATRALDRGHVLTPADIAVLDSDVSDLPVGYASDPASLNGVRLSRPIAAGTVLTASILDIEPLIRRGEEVTAVAKSGGFAIRTRAVALAAAGLDQRVKVKNLSSGKEIEGVVRGEALVEVAIQ